jgi:hypothetical protein
VGILALGSTATGFALGWILALLVGWNKKRNGAESSKATA